MTDQSTEALEPIRKSWMTRVVALLKRAGQQLAEKFSLIKSEITRENMQQVWQQVKALGQWLWAFANQPGPHELASSQAMGGVSAQPTPATPRDWLEEILLPLRPAYRQLLIMSFGINLIGMFTAVFSMQVYDRVIGHSGYATLAALIIAMVIAVIMDEVFRGGRSLLLQRVGSRIEVEVARRSFERLLHLPTIELERRPAAFWQTVFRDIELIRSICSGATAMLLLDIPFLLLTLLFVGFMAWPMLPVIFLIMVMFVILAWRSGKVTRHASEQEKEQLVTRDMVIAELAAARQTLKSLAAHESARQRWEGSYVKWMEHSLQRSRDADRYRETAHAMSTLSTVAITSFGAVAILNQVMTMGGLVGTNILASKVISPLVQLVSQWQSFGQFKAAHKRLSDLFALSLERQSSAVHLPRPQGILKLEETSFKYPGSEHLQVKPISGEIGPFGLHAIVGANGSGKTTLLKLLRGLYRPEGGRVLLDGADLSQFTQKELAQWIGYLPQQVQLLSGSVKDNIVFGQPEACDDDIIDAAQKAGAHDFLIDLPDGYATPVGEAGGRFSGGQRKRIAIAQVLLGKPPILLLDEPTSDLDRSAEAHFVRTLKALALDHLIIVVSHSPALLQQCNGILVLEKGAMVAAGPAAELLPRIGF